MRIELNYGRGMLPLDLPDDWEVTVIGKKPMAALADPVAAIDPEILPSTDPTSIGGTIATRLLVDGKVQCSSCHDVHDVDGNDHLLVIDNTASNMCLTCHKK